MSGDAPAPAEDSAPLPRSAAASDAVEAALAKALTEASSAGRWDVVAQLVRELLHAGRHGRGNVVPLDSKTRRRGA